MSIFEGLCLLPVPFVIAWITGMTCHLVYFREWRIWDHRICAATIGGGAAGLLSGSLGILFARFYLGI